MADEQVLMKMRLTHAGDGREHEIGIQFRPQSRRGTPDGTPDRGRLLVGQIGEVGNVPAALDEQIARHRGARPVDRPVKDQAVLVLPYPDATERPLTPVLRADQAPLHDHDFLETRAGEPTGHHLRVREPMTVSTTTDGRSCIRVRDSVDGFAGDCMWFPALITQHGSL
jgi:hypothetical protein